ncbi:hypothetical protein ABZ656_11805 [Streptomyces sp. NPDC007095]|uniref:hypothetical protein n=1 Tax=Streptomyces sp. NPDC007095 TaxID=3154482 RepID=UPI0033EB02D6
MTITSETVVQQAIDQLVAGEAVVVVVHCLSTVVGADQMLVVEAGRITRRGTRSDLPANPVGWYARMWAARSASRQWRLPAGGSSAMI